MQLTKAITSAMVLTGTAVAQSSTTVASTTTSTSTMTTTSSSAASSSAALTDLVNQLPTCALGCLDQAASDINCIVADLPCLCKKSADLVGSIGPCILLSSNCTHEEQIDLSNLAENICQSVDNSSSSEIAAASSVVMSVIATAHPYVKSGANGNMVLGPYASIVGMGVLGVAAAFAVLAL